MKALCLTHPEMTKEFLLAIAEKIPGAWVGIRIAGYLLMLSGWKSTQVAELFGLSRLAVVKWIRKANRDGLVAVEDLPRCGRPAKVGREVLADLDRVLSRSPREVGINRARWDGVMVVEYLKRYHQVTIHVRHAQRLLKKLGYSLRQPIYRYVQASEEQVKSFRRALKKTPAVDAE
jgi:transposase